MGKGGDKMGKKEHPRVSVSIYVTPDVREILRQYYGKMIAGGYGDSEQRFLRDALCFGAQAMCGCVDLHDGNNIREV